MNNWKDILENTAIDYSWSFSDKTIKDTSYITHGYYTYPAKFIPQLASRLIRENSNIGDIVIDPFMGSGTTIVEAIVNKRKGIGVDINEIASLISKVKTTPINSSLLADEFSKLKCDLIKRMNGEFKQRVMQALKDISFNEKIDYWFLPQQKEKLAVILKRILEISSCDTKDFFLIAFAQILKSCSIWLQKSVKPTRDLNKKIYDPIELFFRQSEKMLKKHFEFGKALDSRIINHIDDYRTVKCSDSRNLSCAKGQADLIVTSPPYVTSYEYADLHQLPSLWFGYLDELPKFRQKFIGSAYKKDNSSDLKSKLANAIVSQLKNKKQVEVKNYFSDMLESFEQMKKVLRVGGRACIVIGNTEFQGVKILNAEVFKEQFENIGFRTHNIIKREIPSKMPPSVRDPKTGKFGKMSDKNKKLVYPVEYILIMQKE
jgi:DNA modification methylase